MHFAHPLLLLSEILVPLIAVFYFFSFRAKRKALAAFGDERLLAQLSSASLLQQKIKAGLLVAALFFILFALARPQFGTKLVEAKQKGTDIIIAVDVSTSMLAQDMKPSRLARAKDSLAALIQQLGGNRVGIVAFAGTAFWQCPLTLDLSSANLFLQIMDANLIPLPGTAIGSAIRLATKGLEHGVQGSKAIILLTDGEDHKSEPLEAAKAAGKSGIKIFTIGFGSAAGEPLPLYDAQGNFTGYKKNKKGDVVMSKLDEDLLLKIAAETGGDYVQAPDGTFDATRILQGVGGLNKQSLSSRTTRQYEDRYQYFLFPGLLLLLAELLIPSTKRRKQSKDRQ